MNMIDIARAIDRSSFYMKPMSFLLALPKGDFRKRVQADNFSESMAKSRKLKAGVKRSGHRVHRKKIKIFTIASKTGLYPWTISALDDFCYKY